MLRHGLAALAALTLLTSPAPAHEGHDHGEADAAPVAAASPRAEAHSTQFELVAVAGHESLTLYLDRYATGEPVDGATLEIMTQSASQTAVFVGDGVYTLDAPWAEAPGRTELTAVITAGAESDLLTLSLTVPEDQAHEDGAAPVNWLLLAGAGFGGLLLGLALPLASRRRAGAALAVALAASLSAPESLAGPGHGEVDSAAVASDTPRRLPDGTLFIPKQTQRLLNVRTILTESREHRPSLALPGHIMPDPNRSGVVQSATGGKLLPPEGGFPLLGQTVEAGQVLAYVQPPFTAIDSSEIRQAMADLDKDIGLARAKLDRLRKGGNAVPRAQIEDAEIELDGLLKARADLESSAAPREALTAPVAGLVAAADVMAGRVVASGDTVFEIIDPQALWVEALAYDPRLTLGVTAASARTSGGVIMPLAFRGAGLATQNQAIPLRFSVEAPPPGLRTGMPVTVFLSLDAVRPGIAVPNAAVVRGLNGQPVVYVQTAAERFEARAVVAEPLDAGTMLVTAGLRPDARVVVSGAELVNQTR